METISQNNLPPTLGNSFSHGWNVMKNYFLILFLVVIVVSVVMGPMNMFSWKMDTNDFHGRGFLLRDFNVLTISIFSFLGFLALAYTLLVVPVFRYGGKIMFVSAARDQRPDFSMLVQGFRENYLNIVLANLLTGALVALGIILFVIPGIIIACRLAFVGYLVMDKKLDPIRAVEESWKMTKGHGWTVFFMAILSFFIWIAGLCLLFVGVFPAIVWVSSSFASLYEFVLLEKNENLQTA
ncbi:MAG: hypothetical protein JXA61_05495 [Bacteroidales bacterium]|nr:hypothetical protein [Bacteroidales bacterium]